MNAHAFLMILAFNLFSPLTAIARILLDGLKALVTLLNLAGLLKSFGLERTLLFPWLDRTSLVARVISELTSRDLNKIQRLSLFTRGLAVKN